MDLLIMEMENQKDFGRKVELVKVLKWRVQLASESEQEFWEI